MRVQGQSQPLDPRSVNRSSEGAKADATRSSGRQRAVSGTGAGRDTGAILIQAEALAARLSAESPEERPGGADRARALLAEPFDPERGLKTALKLLQGEERPGEGRSLTHPEV